MCLGEWRWLSNVNYRLHELCYFPVNLGFFLIPAEMLVAFIFWVDYRRVESRPPKINTALNLTAVFSVMASVVIFIIYSNGMHGEEIVQGEDITDIYRQKYVMLDNCNVVLTAEADVVTGDSVQW